MNRITICGNSGSGKSTLAEELGKITGLPVHHLDMIQFQPGWKKTPEPEFNELHDAWLSEHTWIIEGVAHWKALRKRFEAADTIIYLDFPADYCLQKAKKRLDEDRFCPNPYLPENCSYIEKAHLQENVIRFFHKEWRPKILALMESLKENRNLYVFTKPEGLNEFLLEIKMPGF